MCFVFYVVVPSQVTFVGEGFTRKAPKYERFIRPTGLRFKKAHVTHPELKATFHLDILGVKKNPSSPLYTQVGCETTECTNAASVVPYFSSYGNPLKIQCNSHADDQRPVTSKCSQESQPETIGCCCKYAVAASKALAGVIHMRMYPSLDFKRLPITAQALTVVTKGCHGVCYVTLWRFAI